MIRDNTLTLNKMEKFGEININTELVGKLITAKFNGVTETKKRLLLISTTVIPNVTLSFEDWKKYIREESKRTLPYNNEKR
jgi:hypothetical protein